MSNSTTILAALNDKSFDVVRDENRASMVKWVNDGLNSYKTAVAKWESAGSYYADRKTFPKCWVPAALLNSPFRHNGAAETYYAARVVAAANATVNTEAVIEYADQEWEGTKAFYAARVGEKLDILLGADAALDLHLIKDITLTGTCTASVGSKSVILETNLKTNYRYGENSANGDMTVYRQVPTIVVDAKGFDPAVAELAHLAKADAAKADRKATIAKLAAEVDTTESRKRRWDEIYFTMKHAQENTAGVLLNGNLDWVLKAWAKLGNEGKPLPTVTEAKLALKEAREAHKAAKLALKEAKAAK